MNRQPVDQSRDDANPRVREFIRQERQEGLHPAIQALHARPQDRAETNRKAVEYSRIARGRLT